ncbi:unnamed protein product [Moneuplotes crassus]|uniref:TRP C-terminal domain-containing protein n=1 Tax=Euplotes crassus TaxID=5936 RepID=A0AAD2D656_EUPCR|nr:unnamed protein product [Moneuplotes crassus]
MILMRRAEMGVMLCESWKKGFGGMGRKCRMCVEMGRLRCGGEGAMRNRMVGWIYCDDGNKEDGDGCSSDCRQEVGYICYPKDNETKDTCYELCGDGIQFTHTEEENYCDDGNSYSGDGCSRDCKVEEGFTCSGGSATSKDVCKRECAVKNCKGCIGESYLQCYVCKNGYDLQDDFSCETSSVPENVKQMGSATTAASGAATSVAVGISILSMSSPMAVWFLANQFQLFSLLLLANAELPESIIAYINNNGIFSFSMDFIPVMNNPSENMLTSQVHRNQSNEQLGNIGLESESSLVNLGGIMCTLLMLGMAHLVIYVLPRPVYPVGDTSCKARASRVLTKLCEAFKLGVYVRLGLEGFQFVLLSSFSESKSMQLSSISSVISTCFGVMCLCACIAFWGLTVLVSLRGSSETEIERSKLDEFKAGLRESKAAQLYTPVLLLRRVWFVLWLVCWLGSAPTLSVGGLIGFQSLYLLCLIFVRPFQEKANNLIELINEIIFSLLTCVLLQVNTESRWTGIIQTVFVMAMMANTVIVTMILTVVFIIQIKRKCENTNPNVLRSNKVINTTDMSINNLQRMRKFTRNECSSSAISLESNIVSKIPIPISKTPPIQPPDINSKVPPREEFKF